MLWLRYIAARGSGHWLLLPTRDGFELWDKVY